MNWLSPLNFISKQSDTFDRREEGMGQWLFQTDEVKAWRDEGNWTLWCHGIRKSAPRRILEASTWF